VPGPAVSRRSQGQDLGQSLVVLGPSRRAHRFGMIGANIAGFVKVADAMLEQGVV
jgi:hypothetical protein